MRIWSRIWSFLARPSARYSLGSLFLAGMILGVLLWGGFNFALELSNTEAFCISCHEMKSMVYREFEDTVHNSNPAGVRATCPDCHVPKEWTHKVRRKIQATFHELPHHLLGTINTPEKFEARRLAMAQHVWDSMKVTDSRECRNCHTMDAMDLEAQRTRARVQHMESGKSGETCIDCHKGVAHKPVHQLLEEEDSTEEVIDEFD